MTDNNIMRSGAKKVAITIVTQAVILSLSVITGFILPKKMGSEMFGYWQIYLYYLAYLNIFGIGFNDGIALFYGGYEYKDLPFKKLRSALRIFYIYLIAASVLAFFIVSFARTSETQFIYRMIALNIPLTCLQCIVLTTFISVNKTGIYNLINFLLKALSVTFYLSLIFADITVFKPMIYADFSARLIIVIVCIIIGRKFLFGQAEPLKEGFKELRQKSKAGINITIAAIASTFIPVAGNFIIQFRESVSTYGTYSFAVSLLRIIITFTSTAGIVLFPMLKKLDSKKLPTYFGKLSFICNTLVYIALFAYIPSVIIITFYMPKYISVLAYIHILLAMAIPLGKIQLLLASYYKAFRLEKSYFVANVAGVIAMLGLTFLSHIIFKSVIAVAICSTIVLTIWSFTAEFYLQKKINNGKIVFNYKTDIIMMASFIIFASFDNLIIFAIGYSLTIACYLYFKRFELKNVLKTFKRA